MLNNAWKRKRSLTILAFAMCSAGTGLFVGKTANVMWWTMRFFNAHLLRFRLIRGRPMRRDAIMVRKNQIQPKQVTPTRQSDAVFTQLLITAVRIYGDPALSRRQAGLGKRGTRFAVFRCLC